MALRGNIAGWWFDLFVALPFVLAGVLLGTAVWWGVRDRDIRDGRERTRKSRAVEDALEESRYRLALRKPV